MQAIELREKLIEQIEQLSPPKLRIIADFLAYLSDKESEEATEELLEIPGIDAAMQRAKEDIEAGKLFDWQNIRDDV
jgi:hypothetical protein